MSYGMGCNMGKLKFAFYGAASCGGCEIAVLDINEKRLLRRIRS